MVWFSPMLGQPASFQACSVVYDEAVRAIGPYLNLTIGDVLLILQQDIDNLFTAVHLVPRNIQYSRAMLGLSHYPCSARSCTLQLSNPGLARDYTLHSLSSAAPTCSSMSLSGPSRRLHSMIASSSLRYILHGKSLTRITIPYSKIPQYTPTHRRNAVLPIPAREKSACFSRGDGAETESNIFNSSIPLVCV